MSIVPNLPSNSGKPVPPAPPKSKGEAVFVSIKTGCWRLVVLINSGASFSIAITLYLAGESTKTSVSCSFLSIKNVS